MAKKILVIEDERDIRETIAYILEENGYQVITSESSSILKLLNDIKPDLILLDNWLTEWSSDASGQQLSKELKSDPKTSHIPIIIISAMNNVAEIAEAGMANGYIKKPFDLEELVDVIKTHV